MAHIRSRCGLKREEMAEVQKWEEFKELRAEVFVEGKEEALNTVRNWKDWKRTIWMDSSRLDNNAVGAAVAFKRGDRWMGWGVYLGRNKEVFDAELFSIMMALEEFNSREEFDQRYTIFSDSQAAISRI